MVANKQIREFVQNAKNCILSKQEQYLLVASNDVGETCKDGIYFLKDKPLARFLGNKDGKVALLLADNPETQTEVDLVREIKNTAGIPAMRVYNLPVTLENEQYHNFEADALFKAIVSRLNELHAQSDGVLANKVFTRFYEQAIDLSENVFTDWDSNSKEFKAITKKYNKIYKVTGNAIKAVADWVKNHTYEEAVAVAIFNEPCPELEEYFDFRSLMKKELDASGTFAYLKVIDGKVCTPLVDEKGNFQEIMSVEDAYNLCQHYVRGELRHGQKYGKYTIMSAKPDTTQISCNLYKNETLLDINKQLIEEFNKKKGNENK